MSISQINGLQKQLNQIDRNYRGILFDMDSTLVEADWFSLVKKAVTDSGIHCSEKEYSFAWKRAVMQWRNWIQPDKWEPSFEYDKQVGYMWAGEIVKCLGGGNACQLRAVNKMYDYFVDIRFFYIFEDVLPALKQLKKLGFKIGVVSNWNWLLPELCDNLGLGVFTDVIITSARVGFLKPHPMIFRLAVQGINLPPESLIFIGDRVDVDIKGAVSSGMTPILLNRFSNSNAFDGTQINDLGELLKFLQNNYQREDAIRDEQP